MAVSRENRGLRICNKHEGLAEIMILYGINLN